MLYHEIDAHYDLLFPSPPAVENERDDLEDIPIYNAPEKPVELMMMFQFLPWTFSQEFPSVANLRKSAKELKHSTTDHIQHHWTKQTAQTDIIPDSAV